MAQLKAGSTAGGVPIKVTTSGWTYSDMSFAPGPGLTEGYIRKSGADFFELLPSDVDVTSQMQGATAGFSSGGLVFVPAIAYTARIDRYPFTAPFVTATNAGSLSTARSAMSGQSSRTTGYNSGGGPDIVPIGIVDTFPFTAPFTTTTSVGALSSGNGGGGGHHSTTRAFNTAASTIEMFPFVVTPVSSTNVGTLSQARTQASTHTSVMEGFSAGGNLDPGYGTRIDKFPISAPFTTATNAGDLSSGRTAHVGQSSLTEGFSSGGSDGPYLTSISKFPFTAPFVTSTSAGSLTQARVGLTAQNSTTNGHASGGLTPGFPSVTSTVIDRFPFSAPFTTATNIGALSLARYFGTGQQY